jgi:hypothetical protein
VDGAGERYEGTRGRDDEFSSRCFLLDRIRNKAQPVGTRMRF